MTEIRVMAGNGCLGSGFKLESLWGPSVFVGMEGEQMIGAATLNGAIHLLHTSYTPIPKLLQTMGASLEAMAR